jgi:hypothetical protein
MWGCGVPQFAGTGCHHAALRRYRWRGQLAHLFDLRRHRVETLSRGEYLDERANPSTRMVLAYGTLTDPVT